MGLGADSGTEPRLRTPRAESPPHKNIRDTTSRHRCTALTVHARPAIARVHIFTFAFAYTYAHAYIQAHVRAEHEAHNRSHKSEKGDHIHQKNY